MKSFKKIAFVVALSFLVPTMSMAAANATGKASAATKAKIKTLKHDRRAAIKEARTAAKGKVSAASDTSTKAKARADKRARVKAIKKDYKARIVAAKSAA